MDRIGESGRLWLEREPSYDEVIAEFEKFNMDEYEEVCILRIRRTDRKI